VDIYVYKRKLICAVTLPREGEKAATWRLYDLDGKTIRWGYSRGWGRDGAGCIPVAMDNAKRAARREYTKKGYGKKRKPSEDVPAYP
jgi:hypothetical protein